MIVACALLFGLVQVPQLPVAVRTSWVGPVGVVRAALPGDTLRGLTTSVAPIPPVSPDTPEVRRPRAIEYSDAYYTRLTIHRLGSYGMLPLFAAEYSLGQNLMQDASPPTWMKPAHGLVAGGVAVLFGVNTITGIWNLWDARQDPAGRTRRIVHSVFMLVSDAGFAVTGALAPGRQNGQFVDYGTYLHRERVHRDFAIGSIALSTIGGTMMWFWKQ